MKRCLGCMEIYEDEFDICPFCGFVDGTEAEEKIHMDPGTLLADRYIIGKVLGYGGFGVTYIGWDGKLEQKVAIKEYLPSEFSTRMPGQSRVTVFNGEKNEQYYEGLTKFVEEAKRLAKFQNEPGIVKVFDSFVENETAYIIMEYLDGETLTSRLRREGTISEDEAVEMLVPVMNSLKVVHEEGILHRDIAPDNIFITNNGDIKLIDFGASRYATTSHSRSLTVIIKPGYSPEEQYRSRGDQGPYTDVYALGACLYKMITGKTPPDAMERRALFESKNKDILIPPGNLAKGLSAVRENAILNAMNVRVEDRTPNVQELLDELQSDVPIKRKNGRIRKIDVYKWPLWFKLMASVIVLAFVSFGALMATGVIKFDSLFSDAIVVPDGKVSVPDVEGLIITKAVKMAEKSSLNVAIMGSVTSNYVEAGKIVRQEPASGLYRDSNSAMYLYVSKGNGEIIKPVDGTSTVPYLVGSTEEMAIADLNTAGLSQPDIEYRYDENIAEGLVMSQSKQYGDQLNEQSKISIVISKGPEPFAIADYINVPFTTAQKELLARGIVLEVEEKEECDYPSGTVLEQSKSAGEIIRKLDTVKFVISKAVWSEWSEKEPETKKGLKVEAKTQYSYSDKEFATQKNDSTKSGWTLEKSEITKDEFGPFSKWSTSAVSASDDRQVDTKTQYRSQQKEYTTSNDAALSGWTQIDSSTSFSEYGGWSNWSIDVVYNSETRKTDSKLQYRSRNKEYTTSTNSNLSGWTKTNSYYGDWGNWSGWSVTPVSGSDTRDVDTQTIPEVKKTQYHYYRYVDDTYWHYGPTQGYWGGAYCHIYQEYGWSDDPLPFLNNNEGFGHWGYNSATTYYNEQTREVVVTPARTEYRYRDRAKYYDYEKWGGWSEWSDSNIASVATNQVETRTVYRYADRTKTTTYKYERWSGWGEWSDSKITANAEVKVESRVMYRYSDREVTTEYTFSKWTDYSNYSDNVATESDTRRVKTRTLYRYIYE